MAASPAASADWSELEPAWQALSDDLNVAAALGALFKALPGLEVNNADVNEALLAQDRLHHSSCARASRPETAESITVPEAVQSLADERWAAKQAKDFATADRLRTELTEAGWKALDRKDGFDLEPL